MLRGFNENYSEASKILKKYCTETFDEKTWNLLVETLETMPFAVLIDEVIFCTPSGIPKSSANRLAILRDIPPILRKVEDCPIAYEV